MAEEVKGMKPIWFFVGLILLLVGLVLVVSGIYYVYYPNASGSVMDYLHPDIWWGGLMVITGLIFVWTTRNKTIE